MYVCMYAGTFMDKKYWRHMLTANGHHLIWRKIRGGLILYYLCKISWIMEVYNLCEQLLLVENISTMVPSFIIIFPSLSSEDKCMPVRKWFTHIQQSRAIIVSIQ